MRGREMIIQYLRYPVTLRLFPIIIGTVFTFGMVIHFIEPDNFSTILEGIYWAIITVSTVGYGDFVPKTAVGKVLSVLLIMFATGFVMYYFTQMASFTINHQNALKEGKVPFTKGHHHIIIVGWNERARKIIDHLSEESKGEIVLIDHTLQQNPCMQDHVHFIKGKPFADQTLVKANINLASTIFITADQNVNETQADMNSIMTLLTAKGLKPSIQAIVEILSQEQIKNAQRAGADKIIDASSLLAIQMLEKLKESGHFYS